MPGFDAATQRCARLMPRNILNWWSSGSVNVCCASFDKSYTMNCSSWSVPVKRWDDVRVRVSLGRMRMTRRARGRRGVSKRARAWFHGVKLHMVSQSTQNEEAAKPEVPFRRLVATTAFGKRLVATNP